MARREQDERSTARSADQVDAIREVLWPGGDPDLSWNADTLDAIAQIVGPPPGRGGASRAPQ